MSDDPLNPGNPNAQPVSVVYGSTIAFGGTYRVYLRQNWVDDWVEDFQLHVTQCTWSIQPAQPTAQLVYRYGPAFERLAERTTQRLKRNLGGWYVLIEFDCADGMRTWCGYIVDSADQQGGVLMPLISNDFNPPVPTPTAAGEQTFAAIGIINALDRAPLHKTRFFRSVLRTGSTAPIFNPVSNTGQVVPTRSQDPQEDGAYLFEVPGIYLAASRTAELWSTRDIADYLLLREKPLSTSDASVIDFEWAPYAMTFLPGWDSPFVDCNNKTLLDVFNELIESSRYLGFHAVYDREDDKVYIHIFTYSHVDVDISGETLPRNPNQLLITTALDPATLASVQKSETAFANQVIVRGSKRVVVCTLPYTAAAMWQIAWKSEDETRYNNELATLPTSVQYGDDLRNALLDRPDFVDVFRRFRISHNWNWQIGGEPIFKDEEDAQYYPDPISLRILDELPLYAGVDYSDLEGGEVDKHRTGKLMKPMVIGNRLQPNYALDLTKFHDWSAAGTKSNLVSILSPSYEIRIEPLPFLNFYLNVVGGSQRLLTTGATGGNPHSDNPFLITTPVSSLRLTIAIEEDRVVEGKFPATPAARDVKAVKVIDFGDELRRIDIAPNTVLGVNGDNLKTVTGGTVRDDTALAEKLAKTAAQFYIVPRQIARISSRRLSAVVDVGKIVLQLNPTSVNADLAPHNAIVNTVISEVSVSMSIGNAQTNDTWRSSVTTASGELDPLVFLPKRTS